MSGRFPYEVIVPGVRGPHQVTDQVVGEIGEPSVDEVVEVDDDVDRMRSQP